MSAFGEQDGSRDVVGCLRDETCVPVDGRAGAALVVDVAQGGLRQAGSDEVAAHVVGADHGGDQLGVHVGARQPQGADRVQGIGSEVERATSLFPIAADQVDRDAEVFLGPLVGPGLVVELLQDVDRVGEPAGRLQRAGTGSLGRADQLAGNVGDVVEKGVSVVSASAASPLRMASSA